MSVVNVYVYVYVYLIYIAHFQIELSNDADAYSLRYKLFTIIKNGRSM